MIVDDLGKFQQLVEKRYNSPEYKDRRKKQSRFLKYYSGKYWQEQEQTYGDEVESSQRTPVSCNYIFSTIQTIAPLLTDNRPIWYLRARKYFLQRFFQTYADGLDYLWDKLEMDMQLFKAVLYSLIMGLGVFKVYWRNKEVAIDVVDPRTFVCADGYDDNWDAPWQGTATQKPLSWVRQRFPKTGKDIKPGTDSTIDGEFDLVDRKEVELQSQKVTVFEIWVKDDAAAAAMKEEAVGTEKKKSKTKKKYPNGRILTFAQGKMLEDKPSPFNHGKPNFVTLYDYIMPGDVFGMGEPDQIESMVLEYNMVLRKLAQYVRDYVDPDWAIDSSSGIDPKKFKDERKGGDNVWEINPGSNPPVPLQMAAINRSVLDFLTGLPGLIEEVSGNTKVTKGMAEKKQRQTAGEIATLIESSYTRTRQRVRNLESSIKRLSYLMVDIMQQNYKDERPYTLVRDGEVQAGSISNSAEFAKRTMEPQKPGGFIKGREVKEEYKQELADFEKLVEYLGGDDTIYVDFDIEIQTNSTLPTDKQSVANLMLRLLEMKAVDPQAVLETLRIPKTEEIVARMAEQQQAQQQPQGAQMPQPPQEATQ